MRSAGAFGRFFIASGGSFLAILGLTAFLHQVAGLAPSLAYGITLITVFIANFMILRSWVYKLRKDDGKAWKQFLHTAAASAVFRALEYGGFLVVYALGVQYLLAIVLVMVPSFLGKYLYYKFRVFRGRSEIAPQ